MLLSALAPAVTLVHELGHAVVGLARTEGLVDVQVGRHPGLVQFRVGRLYVSLDPRRAASKFAGYAVVAARLEPTERLAYALAGPAAVAALALAVIAAHHPVVGGLLLAQSAWNLVPRRVGSFGTDGALLRAAYAGWCWRSSQRIDFGDVRESAHDALHAATLTGAVDPWLGVDAALRLARSDASFGALFDGSSGDLDPFAFRCGGALFEIEQIRS